MSDCWSKETLEQGDVGREYQTNATEEDTIDPCASCSGDWNGVCIVSGFTYRTHLWLLIFEASIVLLRLASAGQGPTRSWRSCSCNCGRHVDRLSVADTGSAVVCS
mgnify:FL=1